MGDVEDKGTTGVPARTTLKIRTLKIVGFRKVPHKAFVRDMIKNKLYDLRDVLRIDFTGKAKRAIYEFTFLHKYDWGPNEKIGYRYWPLSMGFSEETNTDLLGKMNFCEDSNDVKTCTPVFPNKPEMLGRAIANTALHEIGHMFGLLNEKSYTGASKGGHTGDSSNCMFDIPLHKDQKKKQERTKKYILKTGETLETIARRVGLPSGIRLGMLRGKDGRTNEEILKNGEKEIWLEDIQEELKFRRKVEAEEKSFTGEQVSFMKDWIQNGKTMLDVVEQLPKRHNEDFRIRNLGE